MDSIRAPIKQVFTLSQSYYEIIINIFLGAWKKTWTERKFSNRKFPGKSEKSYHTHMKQIILSSTVLEFKWLVIDGFMEENGLDLPFAKRKLCPPIKKVPKKFEILPAPSNKR